MKKLKMNIEEKQSNILSYFSSLEKLEKNQKLISCGVVINSIFYSSFIVP